MVIMDLDLEMKKGNIRERRTCLTMERGRGLIQPTRTRPQIDATATATSGPRN